MNSGITLSTVLMLALIATIIKYFGGENLIAGYNTSSQAEKKYMKEKGIGAFVGNYIYALAFLILGGYLLRRAGFAWGQEVGWGIFIAVIIIMLVRVQRFAPPAGLGEPKTNKTTLIILVLSTFSVLAILGSVAWSAMPPNFTLTNNDLQISGAYGTNLPYSEIDNIRLAPDLPVIGHKNNGLDMGPILKGHFKVNEFGDSLLFLRSARGPVIIVTRKNGGTTIFINTPEAAQTEELYQELKTHIQ